MAEVERAVTGGLSLTHAVLGCSDVDVTAAFFEQLGFTQREGEQIPTELAADLYGQRRAVETLKLRMPGSGAGWLRLVAAEGVPRTWSPYLGGRTILEFFARSIEEGVSIARDAGAQPVGTTAFTEGERRNRETRLIGPDGIEIGITQSNSARPSRVESGRPVSEVVTVVWLVESVAAALPGYPEFEVYSDFSAGEWKPAADFLGLPATPAVRTVLLGEPGETLERLQLLEFSNQALDRSPRAWPIRPGVYAAGCEAAIDSPMTSVRPGGVRLEIWPPRALEA